ncbi:MAG: SPOR domain-containing protein [Gammaproteobacteria bacterium]|nr:SPOR domain-containing protein [Gammaproteobacteria bacterium]
MARRSAARPGARRTPHRNGLPGWVWALGGLAGGAFAVTLYFLGRGTPAPRRVPAAPPAATRPAPVKPVPVPPKQASRFTFYQTLPNAEVVITPAEAKRAEQAAATHAPPPADIAAPGVYVVQIGAYRSREEADRARASIALLGVESHTEQVTLASDDIWYRVRVGPEPTLDQAQRIIDRLHANGVKAILIKQKG